MTVLPPRFDVTRPQIAEVVAAFYALVRAHPVLGPVFAAHVTDWEAHEAKITRFWANAILFERAYDGNPQRVHVRTAEVEAGHFALWLETFDGVLHQHLPEPTAQSWSALAHRIGRGMKMAVSDRNRAPADAPKLF